MKEMKEMVDFWFEAFGLFVIAITAPVWFIPYGVYKLCKERSIK